MLQRGILAISERKTPWSCAGDRGVRRGHPKSRDGIDILVTLYEQYASFRVPTTAWGIPKCGISIEGHATQCAYYCMILQAGCTPLHPLSICGIAGVWECSCAPAVPIRMPPKSPISRGLGRDWIDFTTSSNHLTPPKGPRTWRSRPLRLCPLASRPKTYSCHSSQWDGRETWGQLLTRWC